ncbi:hypothetical protein K439DRAFT_584670 [Ramaria rubella]|nr:hypothetical protein K439DRAFT_584670 [Ramaria rubella]
MGVHQSGPSPLPPLLPDAPRTEDGTEHDVILNSPKVSPSHGHERSLASSTPVLSKPEPVSTNEGSWERVLPRSLNVVSGTDATPSVVKIVPPSHRRGHRRTTTELFGPMGPFPTQSNVTPLLVAPDDSNASLFADESIPPPQMSTPTFKTTHLADLPLSPVSRDVPFPPSPTSSVNEKRNPAARAGADLARLQRAVAPYFTFPERPLSPPQPSALPTTLPRQPLSLKSSVSQSESSFPPTEHPELPDPQYSEGDLTPVEATVGTKDLLSTVATPRFPGAFGTPASTAPLYLEVDPVHSVGDLATQTEVGASSRPENIDDKEVRVVPLLQTPAPPGAYRATPTPAKRKGILKVRFDGDSQPSEGVANESTHGVIVTSGNIPSKTSGSSSPPSPSSEDDVPFLNLSPSRHKGLRLVDEYGRARRFTEDGEEIILDTRRRNAVKSENDQPAIDDVTITPRRRAKMRQVDSFGNEVTGTEASSPKEVRTGEVPETKGTKAVFSRLAKSLGEVRHELAEEEDALISATPDNEQRDDARLMDLATVSKTARVERNKLARKLQLERNTEGGLAETVFMARHPTRELVRCPLFLRNRG